ncbi:MAG: acyl-CoA thioesterase [Flavobacteriaceae bacterium]|nr:thioesterase family protein [Flavobacteriaceae bacterium]MDG1063981.1 acyl-CoA thioesterase [Flavobacteriaceae bacterium]MDG1962686.1 acyl-CoA thioesterase [Flavobacteriaceae bacterium]
MYTKKFEMRWSDIDSNLHLRNSAYVDYMSHTRMSYFAQKGISQAKLSELSLGPVVLHEHIHYFKEALAGGPVTVSLALTGHSKDGVFFSFVHNFYDDKGRNIARCRMLGAWIDLKSRKLTPPMAEMWSFLAEIPKAENFKELTKEDLRTFGEYPEDLSI